MFIEERHKEILRILGVMGRISIGEIQERFAVSLDSARRDLRILEEKGLLKRTHGGAIQATQVRQLPIRAGLSRDLRNLQFTDNYLAIAREAANRIDEGDVVFLCSSSLAFAMLRYLPRDIEYVLVINSATLAEELKNLENINVFLTGGQMSHLESAMFVDSLATAFVKNMYFDLSFITGVGVDAEEGFYLPGDDSATMYRTVLHNSRNNILMMPKQKVGMKGFIRVCDVDAFDVLITDSDAVEDQLELIREKGVEVIIAQEELK